MLNVPDGKRGARFAVVGLITLSMVLFAGMYGCGSAVAASGEKERQKLLSELDDLQSSANSLERALELVAEIITPSVVSITSVKTMKHPAIPFPKRNRQHGSPYPGPHGNPHNRSNPYGQRNQFGGVPREFFDFFGGGGRSFKDKFPDREFKQQGMGSGVIVDKDGHILTNNHVVEGADEIKVILGDKREFDGKIIGTDPQSDVAVIKIEGDNLPYARLGDSDALRVGNWAIAIGNPFGLSQTVSVGVISATDRANIGIAHYEDMIQTDAAINPGNSGGPLANIKGEVIGINTAIFTRTGGYQGIGFAIPINMANVIMRSLIDIGRVARGWLGVVIQDLTPALIKQFDVGVTEGVLIADVQKDSPAAEGGVETGDIIIEYEGNEVRDVNHLRNVVAQTAIGKEVGAVVLRDGKKVDLKIKIKEQPSDLFAANGEEPSSLNIGVSVQDLTKELAKSLDIQDASGVVVTDIVRGSPAAKADIRRGDLVKEVNRKGVKNADEFKRAVRMASGDDEILFLVKRGGYTRYVIVKIEE